jgi:hypothetical protein
VIIPLAILKNAVRIVVLSWLAVHIDPSFITAQRSPSQLSGIRSSLPRSQFWEASCGCCGDGRQKGSKA